ncbi:hypothetical protein AVEN_129708-1 [Araneus ventricosus]|uniref:Uncharacterized protein n=1 Tax=Araneus ventricosus TaxID=182803 RepID=A0A4Y2DHV1_ARAVE|nr:hypothetical protein AVEN_129708-1 [Araneus ventricosus]
MWIGLSQFGWAFSPQPHLAITFLYGANENAMKMMQCNEMALKWGVVGKDNWTPYGAYLLSDLRTSPPLRRSNRLRPAFAAIKMRFLDRPGPPR